jgi:hypothetical protein
MAIVLKGCITEKQLSVVFLFTKGLNKKDIHEEMFAVRLGSVCRAERLTTGPRNSLKAVRK